MTRTFLSTTALAAALAVLVPQVAAAETILDVATAAELDQASRASQPNRAAALDSELAAGLTPAQLTCATTGAPRPCDDGTAMLTPEGLAVYVAANDAIVLAARNEQGGETAAAHTDPTASAPTEDVAATADIVVAQAETTEDVIPLAPPDTAEVQADAPIIEDEVSAAEATAVPDAEPVVEAEAPEASTEPAVADDTTAVDNTADAAVADEATTADTSVTADTTPPADTSAEATVDAAATDTEAVDAAAPDAVDATTEGTADASAAMDDAQAADAAQAAIAAQTTEAEAPEAATADATTATTTADPVVEGEAATATDATVETPAAEAESGATATDPVSTEAEATVAPEAPEPITVDAEQTKDLENALAAAQQARAATTEPPQPEATADPAATTTTAAADEAADAAPTAEALNAPPTLTGDAQAVRVTEGSARSSAEDFATKVNDQLVAQQQTLTQQQADEAAARAAAGQPPLAVASGKDESKDDIAKMVLAGVGGYVVGQLMARNAQIALNTGDRVVVTRPDGTQQLIKNDDTLLFQPGTQVSSENFADGSTRTIVTREDGSRVVTIRDGELRVLRRTLIASDGTVTDLIDDSTQATPVVLTDLPPAARPVVFADGTITEQALRDALAQEAATSRSFSLGQVRNIPEVRALVAPVDISAITFNTGSAAIKPDQAQQLATLGKVLADSIRTNPREIFLIEGHTDSVGSDVTNLALSDRRAESVALALTEYFAVPPENLVVQGYGEQFLKVPQQGDVPANRRAAVRRITDLLAGQ